MADSSGRTASVTRITCRNNPEFEPPRRALFNRSVSTSPPIRYGLAPAFVVRLVGLALVGIAIALFVATIVMALASAPMKVLIGVVVLAVAAVASLGWWIRRAWVLRFTDDGYRMRLIRGAGVKHVPWRLVEDAVTTVRSGVPCVELRLKDGRTTTIPVGALDVDKEEFVRVLQDRLQRGHGLRSL